MNNLPKIWLMRQAGRYLPEYRAIREQKPNFMSLCYDSEKAAIVTLQPIDRFGMDAAIIFADILLVLDIIGLKVEFIEKQGPVVEKLSHHNIKSLQVYDSAWQIDAVANTVKLVREKLSPNKHVIGFAGSPWTVATYAIEGRSKTDFATSKFMALSNSRTLDELIDIITEQTIIYLSAQIDAGATIIQLFDSWAGILQDREYHKYVIEPTMTIVDAVKEKYPHIPIIAFPKGSGYYYEDYLKFINFDILGVDHNIPTLCLHNWQRSKIIQGNLDPSILLLSDQEVIKEKIDCIFKQIDINKFIFNLGHGILPTTPIENVTFLVDYVKQQFNRTKFT